MFSSNPRQDQFRLALPDAFFDKAITSKYNEFLKQKPYILSSIEDMVNESIQSFDTPEFGTNLIEQTVSNALGESTTAYQYAKESIQKLNEKTFQITFRHSAGYITYFMLLEHFFSRYKMGTGADRKSFGPLVLEMKLPPDDTIVCRAKYRECYLVGMPALNLSFATPSRDISTFTCNFAYNTFETTFELPELKLK